MVSNFTFVCMVLRFRRVSEWLFQVFLYFGIQLLHRAELSFLVLNGILFCFNCSSFFSARCFNDVRKWKERRTNSENWKHPSKTVSKGNSHCLVFRKNVVHFVMLLSNQSNVSLRVQRTRNRRDEATSRWDGKSATLILRKMGKAGDPAKRRQRKIRKGAWLLCHIKLYHRL